MILQVNRNKSDSVSVEGDFLIDGVFLCHTIERPWMDGANTPDLACILPGTYPVIIDFSPHFNRLMPHILNTQGRSEVRIHSANMASQLRGCIALGMTEGVDFIGESQIAFNKFFPVLQTALTKEQVWITINNMF